MLKIFNTLSGRKEEFVPLEKDRVRVYLCGDTVYDFCHVGHARSKVAFDVVRRYLTHKGYAVNFVRNITDIDDKIIQRAAQNGESIESLTARFTRAMQDDYSRLNILAPDAEPRATAYIEKIIAITSQLIEKGFAYVASDGDVVYSVSKFADYGQLSKKRLADLRAGARVDIDRAKHDPLDFVLWKSAKPGEPKWASPWGEGRPGWHIECSAMASALLGDTFDIHAGGLDLIFPHHENEIAQSCAASGKPFATYWMHNGFVNVDNEKMSKSLGNFFRIRDVIGEPGSAEPQIVRDPEVLRYFLVSSHYRGPINYSLEQLEQADGGLQGLYIALRGVKVAAEFEPGQATRMFEAAMDDDFNTPEALAALQSLATEINRAKDEKSGNANGLAAELKSLANVLGVLQLSPDAFLQKSKRSAGLTTSGEEGSSIPATEIERLIADRVAARRAKDFKRSDEVRKQLSDAGIVLEDKPDGTTVWRRA
jgi:cysteinyl-tRNA synthetase